MGVGGGMPNSPRRPSHVAYYVALVGILSLLLMLCIYFFYFFIRKIKELSNVETFSPVPSSCRPPPATTAYPVQPVVRDSASAMAKLCKQVPTTGKTDTVFPTSTSPAALRTDTGDEPAPAEQSERPSYPRAERTDEPAPDRPEPLPDKAVPVPVVPSVTVTLDTAAR